MSPEVRVLCRRTAPPAAERPQLEAMLDPEELRRRARFVHAADADRFLVGRGTLRREVGRMLAIPPQAVRLELGEHDKPHVPGGPHVNVSHSGDVVLIALSRDAEIGIDVEAIDARHTDRPMVERSFSDAEIEAFYRLPPELAVRAFFHTWTSREAVMKVLGSGFSLPREAFDVSVDPREPPRLLSARPPVPDAITLVPIDVPAGHAAMLAIADPRPARVEVEYA